MTSLNDSLISLHGFSLRSAYSPWERKTFWVLINTIEDEAGHTSTVLSKPEIAMFFEIIEDLLENDGLIPLTRSHELGRAQGLTVSDAGSAVQKMERLRWFKVIKNSDDNAMLVFGPRAITEMPRVRAFVRSYNSNSVTHVEEGEQLGSQSQGRRLSQQESQRISQGSSKRRGEQGFARNDLRDEVVFHPPSGGRGPLPRMSQENELMDIGESQNVRDEDEDNVQPSQSRSQRRIASRSRSTRASRRSSQRSHDVK